MLNTKYCVPNEKYSRKHVYIVYFSCMLVLKRRKRKKENGTNAALSTAYEENVHTYSVSVHV